MIFWLSAVRDQLSGRSRQSVEVWDDKEFPQFESGQHDSATKVGDVVFVPSCNSLDDAVNAQAFDVS
jgi:hypothetical protein